MDAIGVPQLLTEGPEGGTVLVANGQATEQFVAEVLGVTQAHPALFAGVIVVMQQAPIVNGQEVVVAGVGDGPSDVLDQWPGEFAKGDPRVMVEAPGGLRRGESASSTGKGPEASGQAVKGGEVLLNQLHVSVLETFLHLK